MANSDGFRILRTFAAGIMLGILFLVFWNIYEDGGKDVVKST
jgi:hypothetical protein